MSTYRHPDLDRPALSLRQLQSIDAMVRRHLPVDVALLDLEVLPASMTGGNPAPLEVRATVCRELPLDVIMRAGHRSVRASSDRTLPAHHVAELDASHERLEGTPRRRDVIVPQLVPDAFHDGHLVVLRDRPLHGALQPRIQLGPGGLAGAVFLLQEIAVIPRMSDLQNRANRLDSVHCAMRVNERIHRGVDYFVKRSSSAAAKNAVAFRTIPFAPFGSQFSRFSRSSCMSRSRSPMGIPGRRPL